jgi:hypothetical protein
VRAYAEAAQREDGHERADDVELAAPLNLVRLVGPVEQLRGVGQADRERGEEHAVKAFSILNAGAVVALLAFLGNVWSKGVRVEPFLTAMGTFAGSVA